MTKQEEAIAMEELWESRWVDSQWKECEVALNAMPDIDRVLPFDEWGEDKSGGIYVFDIDGTACLVWLVDGNGDGWTAISPSRPKREQLVKILRENSCY